ncbi:DUF4230 domain-containing protein [Sungkyunkwania multivorans]|uniref:DUF4230 domain-containing protein n=1 Tax=Sungkyunkwania multivorans TaxID=1173618 RepID=A0ABW3D2T2_9FLAO
MRKVLFGIIITLLLLLFFQYWQHQKEEENTSFENTQLIQQQIENVGKLVVTEGHFSEVYNYSDEKTYLSDYVSFEKKALVVINAHASIAYDLSELKYELDAENKVLRILAIPEAEVDINPTIKFYDINQSVFNPFTGEDYNKIQQKVREELKVKIESSVLKKNAKNRLMSELAKFYILTNSMGWTLEYKERPVKEVRFFEDFELKD